MAGKLHRRWWLRVALSASVHLLTTPLRNPLIGRPRGLPYQDVTLTASDGLAIAAWYVPGTTSKGIVLVHGINANRAYLLPQARILARAGYHLILPDLRGHGHSEGELNTYGYNFPLHHAEQMYEAARGPKDLWVVHGVPHVNAIRGNEAEYEERIIALFDGAFE